MERSLDDEKMYAFFQERAGRIFAELAGPCGRKQEFPACQMTKEGISGIYKSLQVLYDKEEAAEEACLIENVYELLTRHVQIKGMEHLLVNNYAAIENGIFLEHSSQGNPKRIREHYKHQFRNAYLGLLLLNDFHLDDSIADCILDKKNEYAYFMLEAISAQDKAEESMSAEDRRKHLKEIIYKSFLVGALFHDIGYPLEYYFRTADEIHQFAPFFKIVNPAVKTEFAEIKALLNDSWLFMTVAHSEIRKKYEKNDHGCLSAISFLMNFYFSGSIYSMDARKQCIVEMAAVAIYKHTNRYHKNNRMLFAQDPLSFFLKMCDDLQEWQRFLVCIENTHNYLQCAACGKIVRPAENGIYACSCGRQFQKITQMENRKVNYIDICSGIRLQGDEHRLDICLEYDCYRLLELLLSDYEAVIYRDRGLKDVENMLQHQNYLPDMQLHYFLSNNPAAIIRKMTEQYGKDTDEIGSWLSGIHNAQSMAEFLDTCREKEEMQEFGKQIERNTIKYAGAAREFTEHYLGEIYSYWKFLQEGRPAADAQV